MTITLPPIVLIGAKEQILLAPASGIVSNLVHYQLKENLSDQQNWPAR
jgi:hypothetical protein